MVMELLGRIFTIVTNHLYYGSKGWKFALVLQRDLITFTPVQNTPSTFIAM